MSIDLYKSFEHFFLSSLTCILRKYSKCIEHKNCYKNGSVTERFLHSYKYLFHTFIKNDSFSSTNVGYGHNVLVGTLCGVLLPNQCGIWA